MNKASLSKYMENNKEWIMSQRKAGALQNMIVKELHINSSTYYKYLKLWAGTGAQKTSQKPSKRKVCMDKYLSLDGQLISSHSLKMKLIASGLKKWSCEECLGTMWRESKIPIQLHHINGNHYDNRFENLMILCPNCHAQTPSYAGKNKNMIQRDDTLITTNLTPNQRTCKLTKVDWPTNEDLARLVWSAPTSHISKSLGVSDTAVHKRCLAANIHKPPRGYWKCISLGFTKEEALNRCARFTSQLE